MPTLSDLFKPGSRVLWDGGLGTTLADVYNVETDSPIWSSQVVEDAPETLVDCHLQFLHSGAQVIDTATYQASFSTYAVSNHPVSSAIRLMRQSISLAATARTRYLSTTIPHTTTSPPKIALSLGAFGASLVPIAHEFDGVYPPPYGPDPDRDADTPSRVKFTDAETADGLHAASIDALANFHYERLRVFADDAETWSAIDLISFETIPLAREVRAVRHAVGRLAESGAERKPWVVSTVWQDGRFPEGGVREIVDAALGEDGSLPVLDGIGVNCTLLGNVRRVVRELGARVSGTGKKPWLALKPNGGKVYDPVALTWSEPTREEGKGTWAKELAEVVREAEESGSWAGFLVGGCCKTGFDEIRGLRAVL